MQEDRLMANTNVYTILLGNDLSTRPIIMLFIYFPTAKIDRISPKNNSSFLHNILYSTGYPHGFSKSPYTYG